MGSMGPVFLDWSDSTITHPFLAAAAFLDDADSGPPDVVDVVPRTRLSRWLVGDPDGPDGGDPARALALARVVHPLHMASLLEDRILPGLEQPWELEPMVGTYLEAVLPRLATLPRILRG